MVVAWVPCTDGQEAAGVACGKWEENVRIFIRIVLPQGRPFIFKVTNFSYLLSLLWHSLHTISLIYFHLYSHSL